MLHRGGILCGPCRIPCQRPASGGGGAVSMSGARGPWGEATKTLGWDLSPSLPGWERAAALPSGEDVPSTWPRLGGGSWCPGLLVGGQWEGDPAGDRPWPTRG